MPYDIYIYTSQWRMTPLSLAALSASVLSLVVFLIGIVFTDPGVVQYNYALNFTGMFRLDYI
jgi:hypothetical protein